MQKMTEYDKSPITLQETSLDTLIKNVQDNLDDGSSFTEICRRFTKLVKKHANQSHLHAIREDALGEGWLAVVLAVKNYDENRKINAAGYIESCVKYAIWNLFKKQKRQWDREVPAISSGYEDEELDVFEAALADIDIASCVADKLDLKSTLAIVQKAVSTLSPKQKFVIKRTFLDEYTLTQTAIEMKISPQAVFNLQKRGLKQLKAII